MQPSNAVRRRVVLEQGSDMMMQRSLPTVVAINLAQSTLSIAARLPRREHAIVKR